MVQLFILALIICGMTKGQRMQQPHPAVDKPCGEYGFRCLDSKTFQICSQEMSEGATEKPDEPHKCRGGTFCNEGSPSYCSPSDLPYTVEPEYDVESQLYPILSDHEGYSDVIYYDDNKQKERPMRDIFDHTSTTLALTTVAEVRTTTRFITVQPDPYDCDAYGFFPDDRNQSLFWFCDVPQNGQGFLLRHMLCGANRHFDSQRKACVLAGTTRELTSNSEMKNVVKKEAQYESDTFQFLRKFSCRNRRPGVYPDRRNCRKYFMCLAPRYHPVDHLALRCPENTAFDVDTLKCTTNAQIRCIEVEGCSRPRGCGRIGNSRSYHKNAIICSVKDRFRDLTSCNVYFLCFGNTVIRMQCPTHFIFDDKANKCLPKHIAKCIKVG